MPELKLKHAIMAMMALGAIVVIVTLFSALFSATPGPLDSFARGSMSGFRTVSEAPEQPRATLMTATGEEITLADKRGKILLVNFWATWCAPCIVEMPYLDELQARYGSEDFEVVAISMDQRMEDAAEFYAANGLENLALYHDQSFRSAFAAGARGLPLTVLYDRQGLEIGRLDGDAEWASEDAFALIEAAIARY